LQYEAEVTRILTGWLRDFEAQMFAARAAGQWLDINVY
jgi:hypothetical protein